MERVPLYIMTLHVYPYTKLKLPPLLNTVSTLIVISIFALRQQSYGEERQ